MFYNSPYFNTTRKLEMLRSIFDQARFLKQSTEQNDLLLGSGLVSAGVTFPEMREARKWRNTAMQRCRDYLRQGGEQPLDNIIEVGDRLHAKTLVEVPA